jgi:hypothetical protein
MYITKAFPHFVFVFAFVYVYSETGINKLCPPVATMATWWRAEPHQLGSPELHPMYGGAAYGQAMRARIFWAAKELR